MFQLSYPDPNPNPHPHQVKHKYDQRMFQLYSETFHCLPLCHVLGGKVTQTLTLSLTLSLSLTLTLTVTLPLTSAGAAIRQRGGGQRHVVKGEQARHAP